MSSGRVAIVGLGLIGGSIAKALRARGEGAIFGVDHGDVLALAGGLLDGGAEPGSTLAGELLASADLVVLATPSRVVLSEVETRLDTLAPSAALTDTASVKRAIVARASAHPRASRFVAGHPMAGREIGGFEASRADLFEGAPWFLVDEQACAEAMERVTSLVLTLGARPFPTTADAHDHAMALVSHLPHLVASALAELAWEEGVLGYAGPGFRDTTRIAGGPDAIWRDIFADNQDQLVAALDAFLERLAGVRDALAVGGGEGVEVALELLARARRGRGSGEGS